MNKLIFKIGTLLFATAILYLSIFKISAGLEPFNVFGVLLHVIAYFVLAGFAYLSIVKKSQKAICLAAILVFTYGLTLEVWQAFLPGRVASLVDVIANAAGVVLAIGFLESFN